MGRFLVAVRSTPPKIGPFAKFDGRNLVILANLFFDVVQNPAWRNKWAVAICERSSQIYKMEMLKKYIRTSTYFFTKRNCSKNICQRSHVFFWSISILQISGTVQRKYGRDFFVEHTASSSVLSHDNLCAYESLVRAEKNRCAHKSFCARKRRCAQNVFSAQTFLWVQEKCVHNLFLNFQETCRYSISETALWSERRLQVRFRKTKLLRVQTFCSCAQKSVLRAQEFVVRAKVLLAHEKRLRVTILGCIEKLYTLRESRRGTCWQLAWNWSPKLYPSTKKTLQTGNLVVQMSPRALPRKSRVTKKRSPVAGTGIWTPLRLLRGRVWGVPEASFSRKKLSESDSWQFWPSSCLTSHCASISVQLGYDFGVLDAWKIVFLTRPNA